MGCRSGGGGGGGGFRSSSGGESWLPWSRSRSSPRHASDKPAADEPRKNPPKPASPTPPVPAGGLGSPFTDGMAFGSGDAIGHRVTDAVLGKRVKVTDPVPSAASTTVATSCATPMAAIPECLDVNGGDVSKCQFYMNMVSECRRSSTTLA